MGMQEMFADACTGTVDVEAGWGQGRATYGGLVGGLLLSALRAELPEAAELPLRSATFSFVAPVAVGEAALESTVLRRGSRAVQGQVHLVQEGQVASAMLASFGATRESGIEVTPTVTMPVLSSPADSEVLPFIPGLTPDFFAHVDLRIAEGAMPFSGSTSSRLAGWMRFREAPATFREEHLIALVDAWPPATLQMLTELRPASTLTWTLELLAEVDPTPDAWWCYEVSTDQASGGYAHTHARVWAADGTLVAISRQSIAVFG